MYQPISVFLRQAACFATLFAALSAPPAFAQPKAEIVPDIGRFVALADNSKGMIVIDDYATPGANGQVLIDSWLVLAGATTRAEGTFDAISVSQLFDCRAGTYRDISTGLQHGASRFNEKWAAKKEMVKPPATSPTAAVAQEACNPAPSRRPARFTSYREAASYARLQVKSRNEVWDKGVPAAATGRFELLNASMPTAVLEGQPEQVGEARYGRIWLMYAAPQATKSWRFDNMGMMYAVRCESRLQRIVRTVAFLGDTYVASESQAGPFVAATRGSVGEVVVNRLCGSASPTAKVTSSRAAARSWAK